MIPFKRAFADDDNTPLPNNCTVLYDYSEVKPLNLAFTPCTGTYTTITGTMRIRYFAVNCFIGDNTYKVTITVTYHATATDSQGLDYIVNSQQFTFGFQYTSTCTSPNQVTQQFTVTHDLHLITKGKAANTMLTMEDFITTHCGAPPTYTSTPLMIKCTGAGQNQNNV